MGLEIHACPQGVIEITVEVELMDQVRRLKERGEEHRHRGSQAQPG